MTISRSSLVRRGPRLETDAQGVQVYLTGAANDGGGGRGGGYGTLSPNNHWKKVLLDENLLSTVLFLAVLHVK